MATIRLLLLGVTVCVFGWAGVGFAATELNDYPTVARADYVFACMKTNGSLQYTLRQVPLAVDRALRRKAKQEGKSLNAAAVEALAEGLRLQGEPIRHHDLDFMIGSWVEDPAFDAAIREFDRLDPDLWK